MIRKRLLALALAAALAGSVQAVPVFAVQKAGSGFSDMPTGWSHDAVVYAVEHGYMSGYDGKINPRGYLTRAEMASMMNRAFGNTEKGSLDGYTDVPENAWYRDDMAKAVAKGIFSGYDGKLEPEKNITREEVFSVLARQLGVSGADAGALDPFKDKDDVSSWAVDAAASLVKAGYVKGDEGRLKPKDNITREEFAQLLYKVLKESKNGEQAENAGDNGNGNTAPSNNKNDDSKDGQNGNKDGGSAVNPGGGSGSGDSGNSSSAEKPADRTVDVIVNDQVKTVDLGWATYVIAALQDGYDLSNVDISVDGKDVTDKVTPVNDEKTIFKWEVDDLAPEKLTVTSRADKSKSETAKIVNSFSGKKAEADNIENFAPDFLIAHGPVAVWDYYITNYDDEGNVRVKPSKTTFSTEGKAEAKKVPASYSPETEIGKNLVIMFNYNEDWEKEWFDKAVEKDGSVELVKFDETKTRINGSLRFEKKKNVEHGKGHVGEIVISTQGQDNLSAGRYYVRVKSDGNRSAMVPVHIVNDQEVSFKVKGAVKSGQPLRFEPKNLVYGIKDPIEKIELTDPTGKTTELRALDDYYLFGQDLLTVFNDTSTENGRNNIKYNGKYTMKVYMTGYKAASVDFYVSDGEKIAGSDKTSVKAASVRTAAVRADAVTSATVSAGTGGSSDGGFGSNMISADIMFDEDLLSNAILLGTIGVKNEYAEAIDKRWSEMIPDHVGKNDSSKSLYDYSDFIGEANKARTDGRYLSFADYLAERPDKAQGYPHAVKQVLEDNLLGDIQENGSYLGKEAPAVSLAEVTAGGDTNKAVKADKLKEGAEYLYLMSDDSEYFKKIGSVNVNGSSQDVATGDMIISQDGKVLGIKIADNGFNLGKTNTVVIRSAGYKDKTVSFEYERDLEQVELSGPDKIDLGKDFTVSVKNTGGSEAKKGDFLKQIANADKSVQITRPDKTVDTVQSASAGGTASNDYYEIDSEKQTLTIKGGAFAEPGEYTVTLTPYGYTSQTIKVNVEGEAKKVEMGTPTAALQSDNDYNIDFGDSDAVTDWRTKAETVTVNGTAYKENSFSFMGLGDDEYNWETAGSYGPANILNLDKEAFEKGTENTVVIKAEGYAPVTVTVTLDDEWKVTDVSVSGITAPEEDPDDQEKPDDKTNPGDNDNKGTEPEDPSDKTDPEKGNESAVTDKKAAPTKEPEVSVESMYYTVLKFADADTDWQKAVTSVTVNGENFNLTTSSPADKDFYKYSSSPTIKLGYSGNSLALRSGENTIVIKADGYEDLTLKINRTIGYYGSSDTFEVKISENTASDDSDSGNAEELKAAPAKEPEATVEYSYYTVLKFADADADWQKAVTSVTVNGENFNLTTSSPADKDFYKYSSSPTIKLGSSNNSLALKSGENTIVIKADGYQDLTLKVKRTIGYYGPDVFEVNIG